MKIKCASGVLSLTCLLLLTALSDTAYAFRVWGLNGATISVFIQRDGQLVCDTTELISDNSQICIEEFREIGDFGGVHKYKITGEVIFADGNVRSFTFLEKDFNESLFGAPDCVPVLLRQPEDSYQLTVSKACGG